MENQGPNKFQRIMVQIWPTLYKIIAGILYFLISLIKGIVNIAIEQFKHGG